MVRKQKDMKRTLNVGSTESEKARFDGEDFVYSALTDLGHHYHVDDYHKIPKSVLKEVET